MAEEETKKIEKVEETKGEKVETKKESKPAVEKVSKKKEDKTEKVELEREYVVPMRKGFLKVPQYKRAKKAVKTLKEFMVRHMGVRDRDLRKVKVDINLNNEIWFRGIKKPLHKIKVKAKKVDGIVYVTLAENPEVVGYKIARLEKRAAAAQAANAKTKATAKEEKPADADKDGVNDKVEEKEDAKSEAIKDAKVAKEKTRAAKHTTAGSHAKKTAPRQSIPKK